jgi:GTP-binding protein
MVVVDALVFFDGQVQNIFWLAERNRKGIVILVNKWDLVERGYEFCWITARDEMQPFTMFQLQCISVLNKQLVPG